MFTGIVEARGRISRIDRVGEFTRIAIRSDMDLSDVKEGDSICVNGACLTATTVDPRTKEFIADVSPETLKVTTLGDAKVGHQVNLEKAMRLDSRLGGHLVSGHVDCVGTVAEKRAAGTGFVMGFLSDSGLYLVEKGSVAVDGVSLTVNEVEGPRFRVMIVPHTSAMTGLTGKKVNDRVNLEFDIIAKYVEKFVSVRGSESGVDEKILKEYGFM
jgi:riboflavin synthase